MCVFSFLLNYHSVLGCTCSSLICKSGCAVQGVQRWMFESHSLIMKDQNRKTPNLYREHDQDVSDDSDQTQRSCNENDERYLQSRVRASREEASAIADTDVASVGWIENLHAVQHHLHASSFVHICAKPEKKRDYKTQVFSTIGFFFLGGGSNYSASFYV